MSKKLKVGIILIGLVLVLVYGGVTLLHSPNMLVPVSITPDKYDFLFSEDVYNYEVKYSFGNMKNAICILDIDNKYRCWIWKFNEYSDIPNYDSNCLSDSMIVEDYIDNYYGTEPIVSTYNKMGNYSVDNLYVRVNCRSSIIDVSKGKNFLNLYGIIDEIGVFSNEECDLKFHFDEPTNSRTVFYNKGNDFFILVLYGIDGFCIEEDELIFNSLLSR